MTYLGINQTTKGYKVLNHSNIACQWALQVDSRNCNWDECNWVSLGSSLYCYNFVKEDVTHSGLN